MSKFTKTYNVQPNEKQRESMTRAYKTLTEYHLSKGNNVEIEVVSGSVLNMDGEGVVVTMLVNGQPVINESRYIGVRGGIKGLS